MTVKEVFELRKQGKIEEAYDAIRPMYAAHKGRYTTLCMFWTAADVFKLRLDQGRIEDATQILQALKRMLPRVDEVTKQLDKERLTATQQSNPANPDIAVPWEREETKQSDTQNKAAAFLASATRRLATAQKPESKKKEEIRVNSQDSCSKKELAAGEKVSAISALSAGQKEKEESFSGSFSSDFKRSAPKKADIRVDSSNPCSKKNIAHPTSDISQIDSCSKRESIASDLTVNCQLSTVNSQLSTVNSDDDLSGHLIVSLDEGIIRPIEGINAPQRVVLACITAHPGYSVPQISDSTGIPQKSIERHVSVLIEKKLIEHRGSKKTGGYFVII